MYFFGLVTRLLVEFETAGGIYILVSTEDRSLIWFLEIMVVVQYYDI
jgi:hypothetical protein